MYKEYNLGHIGYQHLIDRLSHGGALSQAICAEIEKLPHIEVFTLLPNGIDIKGLSLDAPLPPAISREYSSLQSLMSLVETLNRPGLELAILSESFLAQPGDSFLLDPLFPSKHVRILLLGATVLFFLQPHLLSTPEQRISVLQKTASQPLWNGLILQSQQLPVVDRMSVDSALLAELLSRGVIAFAAAFDLDGFIYARLVEERL